MLFGVQQGRKLARFPIGKSHCEVRFSIFSRLRRAQKAIFTSNSPPQAENFGILHCKLARFPIGKSLVEVCFSNFSRLRRAQKAIFTPNSPPQAENFGILHLKTWFSKGETAKFEGFGALLDTTRDPDLRLSQIQIFRFLK